MSNEHMIIPERSRDIGNFKVGRLLPFRRKRMVGPFIFIDHMGPSIIGPGSYMDIGQHPHIGLSTLTYLFKGSLVHQDTTGAYETILPGSVNWMTAGRGVVHTERTPPSMRDGNQYPIHGYQIWVALPKSHEEIEPSFVHVEAGDLPSWEEDGIHMTLIAGKAYGRESPVPVYSQLFMIKMQTGDDMADIHTHKQLYGEIGITVVDGYVKTDGQDIAAGEMLISNQRDTCHFSLGPDSCVMVFGGEPLTEERHIFWNFVSSDPKKIEQAKEDWRMRNFDFIDGDNSYIPLP